MSLRDFNAPTQERPITLNHEPNGNGTGLGEFHTVHPEEIEPNNTGKIVGALAVALMVGAAGVYAYTMTGHAANPAPMQQTASLPAPPPVAPPAMTTPAPDSTAPDAAAPVSTPAPAPQPAMKSAEIKPVEKPVKSAAATKEAPISDGASVRMNADSQSTSTSQQAAATPVTPAPAQQAAIPEAVSPAPNPSDVANANPQSGVSVPQGATTAQDMPAQALTPEQPAQQPEAASPAADQPAQAAGQVAQ
ncbi:MAG TPA: hypothetical protein VHM27_12895 [Rhizomicrobium sp.]|jgi:hypothetical protein|nr:hypothetical protein [Rhizomicrobium sp.]